MSKDKRGFLWVFKKRDACTCTCIYHILLCKLDLSKSRVPMLKFNFLYFGVNCYFKQWILLLFSVRYGCLFCEHVQYSPRTMSCLFIFAHISQYTIYWASLYYLMTTCFSIFIMFMLISSLFCVFCAHCCALFHLCLYCITCFYFIIINQKQRKKYLVLKHIILISLITSNHSNWDVHFSQSVIKPHSRKDTHKVTELFEKNDRKPHRT